MPVTLTAVTTIRVVLVVILLYATLPTPAAAQSVLVEGNFADSAYSALVEPVAVSEISADVRSQSLKVRVLDSYYGDVMKGREVEILIRVPASARDRYREILRGEFLVSFCGDESRGFFTHRDFLVLPATESNIAAFVELRDQRPRVAGSHDCSNDQLPLGPISG